MRILTLLVLLLICGINELRADDGGISVSVAAPSLFQSEATVTVENRKHYPQVIKLTITNRDSQDIPVAIVLMTVDANGFLKKKVPALEGKSFSNQLNWFWIRGVGDNTKKIEDDLYRIPFEKDVGVIVCQYPHGNDPAIDFCAPIGTKVVAAKGGVVIWTVDEHGDGGNDPTFFNKANLVEIFQPDGSRALYTHLKKGTVKVKAGDKVVAGQYLGDVGLSGQTSGPHLHFHVVKLDENMKDQFIVPRFRSPESKELEIRNGYMLTVDSFSPPVLSRPDAASNSMALKKPDEKVSSNSINALTAEDEEEESGCANGKKTNLEKGAGCYSKNKFRATIKYLKLHVRSNPNDALSLARIAISHTRLGEHQESIQAYKNAVAKGWISYDFAALYSESLFQINQRDEALKWSRRAYTLVPECLSCRSMHAQQLRQMGRQKEALQILKEYDDEQAKKGKQQRYQGLIMLIEDDLSNK
jgi:murein DD-endopeptidase MepM/ murein hydrolase activator NlpD